MDFDLTDEQRLLKDSVDRLIADQYQFEQRKKYQAEVDGWGGALWQQYAELGLLGLPFAEAHGGFGGGAVETMIVMEAFGRGLVLEPYFATVILGGGLLRRAASPARQQELLPQVAQGKLKLAFATGRHSTVGIDLVAMSVNDVLCAGAEPLLFLDYVAMSRDDTELTRQVVQWGPLRFAQG